MVNRSIRSSPIFAPLAAGLAAVFVSLVVGGRLGEVGYLTASVVLCAVAVATWKAFERPNNWAATSALLGLISAAVFAATELGDVSADGGGGPAIIPVAWLFAATSWYTHFSGVRTLRWVITLVQVSFSSLSALLFVLASSRADDGVRGTGYGTAAAVGVLAGATAIIGIVGRIRIELARRNP
jgi:hypothetical protein